MNIDHKRTAHITSQPRTVQAQDIGLGLPVMLHSQVSRDKHDPGKGSAIFFILLIEAKHG